MMKNKILSIIACPRCKISLEHSMNMLKCPSCLENFEIVNGVPVLLLPENRRLLKKQMLQVHGKRMVKEYHTTASPGWIKLIRPPEVHFNAGVNLSGPAGDKFYDNKLVLNVGGGPSRYRMQEITLNMDLFPNVDVVGDAHAAPFPDAIFDTVICNAVLEHVHDPKMVINEIYRMLKPDGLVYVEMPFLWFYHGYPSDYWRVTLDGLRELLKDFEELESGMTQGPTGAMLQQFVMYIMLLLRINDKSLPRKMASFFMRWLLFPLRYIDIWLNRYNDAYILAGGFYFSGQKKTSRSQFST